MPIKINKPIGYTPLELIEEYKKKNSINEKMSFAGRLDPMAYGLMILLRGIECKSQNLYCGKDKIYEFNILYGFKTDTLDILGIPEKKEREEREIKKGKIFQSFPIYSSKTLKIDGKMKPLWCWAKEGKLDNSLIPKKEVEIYEIDKLNNVVMNNSEILEVINKRISKLSKKSKKSFRYNLIKEKWAEKLNDTRLYKVEKYKAKVSSGTYIRGLCDTMGGVAFDINRIDIIF